MKLTKINIDIGEYPSDFRPLLSGAKGVYDSSCSPQSQVIFVDKDKGYFLKSAQKSTLSREAKMTEYFCAMGLSAKPLLYISEERDWLLTEKIWGDDLTSEKYLTHPERLCDNFAQRLALLHAEDFQDCPVPNHTELYLTRAKKNKQNGTYDKSGDYFGYKNEEEAWAVVEKHARFLKTDTLLHGDYCLPNVIFDDWNFSGFIDIDSGGVGDRHVDLFWGIWTLWFNLKTDKYTQRFIDAYGRSDVDKDLLRVVAAVEVFG